MTNKKSGNKSRRLNLTNTQKLEVSQGHFKKNQTAKVNGKLIKNSGIKNYFLEYKDNHLEDICSLFNNLIPIKDYAYNSQEIYFACKALNYRVNQKWDGNRPLAVWINWNLVNERIFPKICLIIH